MLLKSNHNRAVTRLIFKQCILGSASEICAVENVSYLIEKNDKTVSFFLTINQFAK